MAQTSIAIAKSVGGRAAITDTAGTNYYSYGGLTIKVDGDYVILEFFASGDKFRALRLLYTDITAPAGASAQLKADAIDALLV